MRNTTSSVRQVTAPKLPVVRLHGRNHETWIVEAPEASAGRFNYDGNTAKLADLAKVIQQLSTQADLMQVIFNNNGNGHQRNGMRWSRAVVR